MSPDIYWIRDIEPTRMAIMPRPRGGEWLEDEIEGLGACGVSVLVSLLEDQEIKELDLTQEARFCAENGMEFVSYPIRDRGVPESSERTQEVVGVLTHHLRNGAGVAIHCRAGIGRSSLIAACVLSGLGIEPAEAFSMLSKARRLPVPDTDLQRDWLTKYSFAQGSAASSGVST